MKNKIKIYRWIITLIDSVAVYFVSYAVLRLTSVLVTRSYLVYHYDDSGDEIAVEYFDIGHRSAYGPNNEPRFHSLLGFIFFPSAKIELLVRGIDQEPLTYSVDQNLDAMNYIP